MALAWLCCAEPSAASAPRTRLPILFNFTSLTNCCISNSVILAKRSGVWRVIQHSKHHLDRVRWLSLPVAEHIPHLIAQHQAIVEAVSQRDPDIAEASLRVHLREVYATIEQTQS